MAPKRKLAAGKATPKLAAHNFLPVLTKPAEVIGDYVSLQGKEWTGCPAADKEKWFRCTVRQFEGVHDFGAFKSAAFQVQEMGQSGEGSLEPGVASGGQFWIAYVNPFLKYYTRRTQTVCQTATLRSPPKSRQSHSRHKRVP